MKSKIILYEIKYEEGIFYTYSYYPLNKAWCKTQYNYSCPDIYFYNCLNKGVWVEEEKFIPVRYYK